jgi:hypothetical protein
MTFHPNSKTDKRLEMPASSFVPITYKPSVRKRFTSIFYIAITIAVALALSSAVAMEIANAGDAQIIFANPETLVLLSVSFLTGWYILFQCLRQLIIAVHFEEHELFYSSYLGDQNIKYADFLSGALVGRSTSGFSMTFKLWHRNGSFLITNHEFSTKQVLEISQLITRLLSENKKDE